ncbi:TPA: hypothetical protein OUH16_004642 [Escherichia coli]|nr:hypothetical protein [Escherichia coli]
MNKETIKCPFCFKESEIGVRVCTGCHSTVNYGEISAWSALFMGIILTVFSFFVFSISQSFLLTVVIFFTLAISIRLYIRKKYAHRALFTQKS